MKKLTVALVSLRFGAEFAPIYLHHPDVDEVMLRDLDEATLDKTGEKFGGKMIP